MAVERLEQTRLPGLPEGITTDYPEEYGGSFAIYQDGDLVALGRSDDEKSTFRAAFNGSGARYYEI